MKSKQNKNNQKLKIWNSPKIVKLSVKDTAGGARASNKENPTFHIS